MNMKTLAFILLFAAASFDSIFAAVTLSGTAARGLKDHLGTDQIAGMRVIWVVDSDNSNSFGGSVTNSVPGPANVGVGQLFGGDLIVGSASTQSAFGQFTLPGGGTTIDNSTYSGRQFGAFWFDNTPAATTSAADGAYYGFVTDPSWIVPVSNGSFGFANPINVGAGNPFLQVQNVGNASLIIGVPEPSRIMLLGLGAVGLIFRRRRN